MHRRIRVPLDQLGDDVGALAGIEGLTLQIVEDRDRRHACGQDWDLERTRAEARRPSQDAQGIAVVVMAIEADTFQPELVAPLCVVEMMV